MQVGTKDRFKAEQDAVEVELKAESMVSAVFADSEPSHATRMLAGPVGCTYRLTSIVRLAKQVRATEALLSLSHTLKLLFLLNDEDEGSSRIIETQQEQMTEDLKDAKKEAESLLASLLERQ